MSTRSGLISLARGTAWLLVAASGSGLAHGQDIHLEIHGESSWLLSKVRATGDVDGDGVSELVIGGIGTGSTGFGGLVALVSGADGHPIHPPILGPHDYGYGAWVDGVGDFDGDGIPDFASGVMDVGPGIFDGEVNVWSGADASLLANIPGPYLGFNRRFGWQVTGLGDLDGDGKSEIGAVYDLEGHILIFSGPDGHLFRIHRGDGCPNPSGGQPFIDSIGDLDQDQVPDYAVGWHFADINCYGGGVVFVYSGRSGDVLRQFDVVGEWFPSHPNFGQAVADMGDVTGDGLPDLAVSATFDVTCNFPDAPEPAFIRIYSLADGSLVRQIEAPRVFRWALGCTYFRLHSDGHDVNGDGVPDLAAGSPFADRMFDPASGLVAGGLVSVFSGATGTMLWQHHVISDGNGLALTGDLTGDGLSEFAVGSAFDGSVNLGGGSITVYEGAPGDAERFCPARPNSVGPGARIDLEGPISVGNDRLHLVVELAPPNQLAAFVYGPETPPTPFGDGLLCAGPPGQLGKVRTLVLDASGSALERVSMLKMSSPLSPGAWLPGSTWVVQCVYRDPAGPGGSGFNTSDAVRVTFTP